MNAIEFVREHGVGYTRGLVARLHINDTFNLHKGGEVAISDLKEIVEAFELVESYGGIQSSKDHLNHRREYGLYQIPKLTHSINLVEQCNAKS